MQRPRRSHLLFQLQSSEDDEDPDEIVFASEDDGAKITGNILVKPGDFVIALVEVASGDFKHFVAIVDEVATTDDNGEKIPIDVPQKLVVTYLEKSTSNVLANFGYHTFAKSNKLTDQKCDLTSDFLRTLLPQPSKRTIERKEYFVFSGLIEVDG